MGHDLLIGSRPGLGRLFAGFEGIFLELRVERQPAEPRGKGVAVRRVIGEAPLAVGRRELVHTEKLVTPRVEREIIERGAVVQARRPHPVAAHGHGGPTRQRAYLLLPHVVRPAPSGYALTAAERGQGNHGPVGHVVVVPVVDACTHDDHGTPARAFGVVREFPRHADHILGGDAGDRLLPCGSGVGPGVFVTGRHIPAVPAIDGEACRKDVEHRGDEAFLLFAVRAGDGQTAHRDGPLAKGRLAFKKDGERGKLPFRLIAELRITEDRIEIGAVVAVAHLKVPGPFFAVTGPDGAVGHGRALAGTVVDHEFPFRVVAAEPQIRSAYAAARRKHGFAVPFLFIEEQQERQVREALGVILKIRHATIEIKFFQDDMVHRHGQCAVRTRAYGQPMVGELGEVGVVRGNRGNFSAPIPGLDIEVGVRRAGLGQVGTPRDDVARVVPVRALGHVGLLAPNLRRGRGQVAVPVVEADHTRAEHGQEPRPGCEAGHGHGGQRREAENTVRAMFFDGGNERGGDDLGRLIPREADKTALPPRLLVGLALGGIGLDGLPGGDGIVVVGLFRGFPHFEQLAADIRILHAQRAVDVPRGRDAARTAARLVVGEIGVRRGIVGLLGLPHDDPVLDEHIERTGPRTVDPVGGTHHLVVLPAPPIVVFPRTAALPLFIRMVGILEIMSQFSGPLAEVPERSRVEETHEASLDNRVFSEDCRRRAFTCNEYHTAASAIEPCSCGSVGLSPPP